MTPAIRPIPTLSRIFLAALAVRWTYALLLYATLGDDGLKGVDSIVFDVEARQFATAIRDGLVDGWHWLGEASSNTMPLYQLLMALCYLLFGRFGAIAYVLMQGAMDSASCVLAFVMARSLDRRLGGPAAIFAIFNPTQIVMSGLIYTDTLYTLFVMLSFVLARRWVRNPALGSATVLGLSLACATLTRVSIAPWGVAIIGLLLAYSAWQRRSFRQLASLSATAVILSLSLAMISARNHGQYGSYELSAQTGEHMAWWIVPLAREMQDRTPYADAVKEMNDRTNLRYGPTSPNPFEQSRRYQQVAREALRDEIKPSALIKSWASGAFINLVAPAHLISPPVSRLPRTGFYDTPGASFAEKVSNYAFRSGNPAYSWLLIAGTFGVVVMRLMQMVGLVSLARHRSIWPSLLFATSWFVFLLLVNGPIASPKYRLPLEPLFDILSGAGWVAMWTWWRRGASEHKPDRAAG
jgi:4-amino-4-deoxy-L-arabinose transferase-like glycosyltransferase